MLKPFSKSANAVIQSGDTITDLGGRPWIFQSGYKPGLVTNTPNGEIYVKKLETDARPKKFHTTMFPDIEFREIVTEAKVKVDPAKKGFVTERKTGRTYGATDVHGTRTGRFDAKNPQQSNAPKHA